jgi:predicted nucleic acid-binding protein
MIIFLDTSSLFKLYHKEVGTEAIDEIFATTRLSKVFLSEIAKLEFASSIWKKVRTGEITPTVATSTINHFELDSANYIFIPLDNNTTLGAATLLAKYGAKGLRTLDSIQLSTATSLRGQCDIFITSDKLLNNLFEEENLPTKIIG